MGTKDDECLRVIFALDFMVDCLWFDSLMRSTCRGDSHAGRRMPRLLDIPAFFPRVGFEMASACACFFFFCFVVVCRRPDATMRNRCRDDSRAESGAVKKVRSVRRQHSFIHGHCLYLPVYRTLPVPVYFLFRTQRAYPESRIFSYTYIHTKFRV